MKVYRSPISERDFLKLISNIKFGSSKEKIFSLGGNLTIRTYTSGSIVFFYRSSQFKKLLRIGRYKEEFSFNEALSKCKEIDNDKSAYVDFLISKTPADPQVLNPVQNTCSDIPYFKDIASSWLDSKKSLVRYSNYRKCVEYLSFLNSYRLSDIRNIFVKQKLLSLNLGVYKLRETISVLCRIMDLAVQDEYINHHNLRLLANSDCLPKQKIKSDGYKYVEFSELKDIFPYLKGLPQNLKFYFMMLIMTCLRPGECRQLKFDYFDLDKNILNIPGHIMKVKTQRDFRIPLSSQAVALFKNIKKFYEASHGAVSECDYMFHAKTTTLKPLHEREIATSIKICTNGKVHPHGFRKTARSFFADHGVHVEVAALCLAHQLNTGADAVYQKSDLLAQRRIALEEYNQAIFDVLPDDLKALFN